VALCGHRPQQHRLLASRRVKLGLLPNVLHPRCGRCARRVAAPRHRVAVPVVPSKVRVPVSMGLEPVGAARPTT
jgi:hypothetical protein